MVWTWNILWQLLEQSPVGPRANPSCVLEKLLLHPRGSSQSRSFKTQKFQMVFLKNIWWGNRNWKFCGRSGLKVLCKHFGFQGHVWEPCLCFPQYQPTLQNMHKTFSIFSFNKLNIKWGPWQVKD